MTEQNIIEDTQIVVHGEYTGDILPIKHIHTKRDVYLNTKALVKGGIYGRDIHVQAGAKVLGPVLANRNMEIVLGSNEEGKAYFGSEIYAYESLLVIGQDSKRKIIGGVRAFGDVYSRKVNLKHAEIVGSVIGNSVVLEDCFVHGLVIARNGPISLIDSTAFLVHSVGDIRIKDSKLVYPFLYSKSGSIIIDEVIGLLAEQNEDFAIKKSDISSTEKGMFAENFWRTRDVSSYERNLGEIANEYVKKLWSSPGLL